MGVSDTKTYPQRYNRGISRLSFIAAGIALLGIVLLGLIFTLFA
jgi:hypothetical protein